MIDPIRPLFRSLLCLSFALTLLPASAHADQWTAPTPEELSMTAQPEVPGASAVYLFREEISEDDLHMYSVYTRIKVLNEGGKKFGDVELKYSAGNNVNFSIGEISGRTIHPDGTIVPFTGKPYQKLIEKGRNYKYMAKVFSMPDVQVGSIIEYRYVLRWDDMYFVPPSWYVQSDLFTRKAHYLWKPTNRNIDIVNARGQLVNGISWAPVLPPGAKVVETQLPAVGQRDGQVLLDLAMHDVPPAPTEEYMPPMQSFTYRVLFYRSAYRTADEFWKKESVFWAKDQDKFIGPGNSVKSAVNQITAPTDTPDQKLHKIYAAIQAMDNTRFTRSHSGTEDKSLGLRDIRNTDDILGRKRGTDDQLTQLFVAMARAAGFKAYVMGVTSRDQAVFYPGYLSLDQLNDLVAIVNVDGKDVFFDPGSRFCPYAHLAWKHTLNGGVRQTDGGAVLASTPDEPYTSSRVQRVANLTLDHQGVASGTVKMTYIGAPALGWRQNSLEGDDESLRRELRTAVEELLPHGMEVKLESVSPIADYEQPLVVTFNVSGPIGSATGKRLLIPGDIFEANEKVTFPHEKREVPIYFHYGHIVQDAVRINFPRDFAVESAPVDGKFQFRQFAAYTLTSTAGPDSVTTRKNYSLGEVVYMAKEYPELRTFYTDMEAKDQQNFVLKVQTPPVTTASSGVN